MNGTAPTSGFFGTQSNGFRYGVGLSIAILLLIATITLVSYYYNRNNTTISTFDDLPRMILFSPHPLPPHTNAAELPPSTRQPPPYTDDVNVTELGLDEATLSSYPRLLYSEAMKINNNNHKGGDSSSTVSCCSICLADYKGSDMLMSLPDCGHLFHVKCVDTWLRLHPTCPVCRTSPLAEVVPLATRPLG